MTNHSSIMGGSNFLQRVHCTASAGLEGEMPEREEAVEDWTLEGDAMHWLMYRALDTGEKPARDKPYVWSSPKGKRVTLSSNDLEERFWPSLEATIELMKRHKIEEYDIEIEYTHPRTSGEDVFGTIDFVGRSKDGYTVVVDFKFGAGVKHHAKENYQLGFYTTGLWEHNDPLLVGDKLVFVIIQPWRGDDEKLVDEWETSTWWVENLRQIERTTYQRIKSGNVAFKAGHWCQFCRARSICDAQNQNVEDFALQAPQEGRSFDLDPLRLAALLDMGERAKKQYDALLKYARDRVVDEGITIPGWKAVSKKGNRKWKEDTGALGAAVSVLGNDAMTRELKSVRQLELTFKRAGEDFEVMQTHITRDDKGYALVRDTDRREQATFTPGSNVALVANVVPLDAARAAAARKKGKKEETK